MAQLGLSNRDVMVGRVGADSVTQLVAGFQQRPKGGDLHCFQHGARASSPTAQGGRRDGAATGAGCCDQPRSTTLDLPTLVSDLVATSLLTVEAEREVVFVHRWTASELDQRWRDHGHDDQLREAHSRAAQYWLWRVAVWPQDRDANLHDRLEARHHLLAAGSINQANVITDNVCSRLHVIGAWDHETALIHDTLSRYVITPPQQATWLHRLGMLAELRGDYPEAERRYTASLTINEELGNPTGIAACCCHPGMLAEATGNLTGAVEWHLRAAVLCDQLGVPQLVSNLRRLAALRENLGQSRFSIATNDILPAAELATITALLNDINTTDDHN